MIPPGPSSLALVGCEGILDQKMLVDAHLFGHRVKRKPAQFRDLAAHNARFADADSCENDLDMPLESTAAIDADVGELDAGLLSYLLGERRPRSLAVFLNPARNASPVGRNT